MSTHKICFRSKIRKISAFLDEKNALSLAIWHRHFLSLIKQCRHMTVYIATDKRGYPHDIFLISEQKHMLWYSLEAPRWGASNEYPQNMFSFKNKKDISIFGWKKCLISCNMTSALLVTHQQVHWNLFIRPFIISHYRYKMVKIGPQRCCIPTQMHRLYRKMTINGHFSI